MSYLKTYIAKTPENGSGQTWSTLLILNLFWFWSENINNKYYTITCINILSAFVEPITLTKAKSKLLCLNMRGGLNINGNANNWNNKELRPTELIYLRSCTNSKHLGVPQLVNCFPSWRHVETNKFLNKAACT